MADMSIKLKDRLALRVDREIGIQMDTMIEKVIVLARKYRLGEEEKTENSANSPFKNVLNVSVEPSSSLEVIKNFIRYQTGRKGASKIWGKQGFADALVTDLDRLSQDVSEILARIKAGYVTNSSGEETPSKHSLVEYIDGNSLAIQRALHLQLVQLYLGYLSREHIASKGGVPGKVDKSSVSSVAPEKKEQVTAVGTSGEKGKPSQPSRPKKRGHR